MSGKALPYLMKIIENDKETDERVLTAAQVILEHADKGPERVTAEKVLENRMLNPKQPKYPDSMLHEQNKKTNHDIYCAEILMRNGLG